jgi:hypothetical protein
MKSVHILLLDSAGTDSLPEGEYWNIEWQLYSTSK